MYSLERYLNIEIYEKEFEISLSTRIVLRKKNYKIKLNSISDTVFKFTAFRKNILRASLCSHGKIPIFYHKIF